MIWSLVSLVGLVSVFGAGVGISWSWREASGAGTSISKACKSSGLVVRFLGHGKHLGLLVQ